MRQTDTLTKGERPKTLDEYSSVMREAYNLHVQRYKADMGVDDRTARMWALETLELPQDTVVGTTD